MVVEMVRADHRIGRRVKTRYQIYFLDRELGGWTMLQGGWGSELACFDVRSEAERVVAELQEAYPDKKWEIREVPETYWSGRRFYRHD